MSYFNFKKPFEFPTFFETLTHYKTKTIKFENKSFWEYIFKIIIQICAKCHEFVKTLSGSLWSCWYGLTLCPANTLYDSYIDLSFLFIGIEEFIGLLYSVGLGNLSTGLGITTRPVGYKFGLIWIYPIDSDQAEYFPARPWPNLVG